WLAELASAAHRKWPQTAAGAGLVLKCESSDTIASSKGNCVLVDLVRAWSLAHEVLATRPRASDIEQDIHCSVVRFLLAHEVGHSVGTALQSDIRFRRFLDDGELLADAVAGWLASDAGDSAIIGSAVADFLGCQESHCTHPAPGERSLAYL